MRRFLIFVFASALLCLAPLSAAATVPPPTEPPVTIVGGREVTDCISSNPKPGCGTRRNTDGHQVAVLAVLASGVAFIGWRVARGVRQRDRAVGTTTR